MMPYYEAIRRAVKRLPLGSKRLRAGLVQAIAAKYGKTAEVVRFDVEELAKRRSRGEGL